MPPEGPGPDPRALLAETLYADPIVGPKFKELIAEKFPTAPIPEIHARKAMSGELEPLKKELEALRAERTKERQSAALQSGRESVMNDPALRITAEEMPEIEKLMQAGEAGTHKVAAAAYRYRQRLLESRQPTTHDFSGMRVPGHQGAGGSEYAPDEKSGRPGILQDRRGWTRARINEVLAESARENPLAPTWR